MTKKRMIFLAIAVLYGFTPWFSWLRIGKRGTITEDSIRKLEYTVEIISSQTKHKKHTFAVITI